MLQVSFGTIDHCVLLSEKCDDIVEEVLGPLRWEVIAFHHRSFEIVGQLECHSQTQIELLSASGFHPV